MFSSNIILFISCFEIFPCVLLTPDLSAVLCLLLYWVIPKKQEWLTMVAAGCGIMTIMAMIFFLYFNNRKEGKYGFAACVCACFSVIVGL